MDAGETDTALEAEDTSSDKLAEVHKRAMRRFDDAAWPTAQNRAESLAARRFITVPGAQWEGDWGDQFENAIKLEVANVGDGVRKIERDYRDNRIVPDFRPDGKDADPETAEMLDGLHRADSYRFKAQQARDNAAFEAIAGGFGAYRLTNEWEDQRDKDNDNQRINPAALIIDADQSVFFDIGARLLDKSDASHAFLRVKFTPEAFKERFGEEAQTDFPDAVRWKMADWFMPQTIAVAEYYEREEVDDTLWVLTHGLSKEERREWASDMEPGTLASLKADGWEAKKQRRKRCRIHKYILSGAEVLEDLGLIAGEEIPIVPVYGNRYFVDGIERWKGYVQDRMDAARLYNSSVSKLAETNALSPREVPIFAPEQMDTVLSKQWAEANVERLPYLLAHPLVNPDGTIAHLGPIGALNPPSSLRSPPRSSSLRRRTLTPARRMAPTRSRRTPAQRRWISPRPASMRSPGSTSITSARPCSVKAKSISAWPARSMSREGRGVETMTEDGDDGVAVLKSMQTDAKSGASKVINDLSQGRYKVIVSVSEATATRRDKTVKAALNIAQVAVTAQDMELAQAALLTAVQNTDGEGINELQDYARQRGLGIGLNKPNEEEKAEMEKAAENAKPDAMQGLAEAQSADLQASAAKKTAEIDLTKAKTLETLASAKEKAAGPLPLPVPANEPNDPYAEPQSRFLGR